MSLLNNKYEIKKQVGEGSYGKVIFEYYFS